MEFYHDTLKPFSGSHHVVGCLIIPLYGHAQDGRVDCNYGYWVKLCCIHCTIDIRFIVENWHRLMKESFNIEADFDVKLIADGKRGQTCVNNGDPITRE